MRIILISLFIAFIATTCFCQAWFPEGATWHYDSESWFPFPKSTVTIFTAGEEVIVDNKVCRRVYGECGCGSYGFENILFQEGDIIYRYDEEQDTFSILYDFTMLPGDTLSQYLFEYRGQYILDSVTTSMINGIPVRVQHFSEVENEWVVNIGLTTYEFIGNNQCLYPQFGTCDPGTGPLRCYEDDQLGLTQFNHIGLPCDYTDATQPVESIGIQVNPNPASGVIDITFENRLTMLSLVELLSGKEVHRVIPNNSPYQIDLSTFAPGIYVLHAREGSKVFYKQIAVVR